MNIRKYVDENGTISLREDFTKEDAAYCEVVNQAKTVAELIKTNALYAQELRLIKRNSIITLWTSVIAALTAIFSALLQIF